MKAEAKYPYLNLQKEFIPIAKEYWETTHKFVCYGWIMEERPGMSGLVSWLEKHHPYWMLSDEERKGLSEKEWEENRPSQQGPSKQE